MISMQKSCIPLTEGWISALYLLMLDYISEGCYSNVTDIYKLLDKTVFASLSDENQGFPSDNVHFRQLYHRTGGIYLGKGQRRKAG